MRPVAEQINARRRPAGQRPVDRSDRPRPFVKWAGGKTQLLSQLFTLLPADFESCDTYVEPFVGGGAMLFAILDRFPNLKRVVINDANEKLTFAYRAVRNEQEGLRHCLLHLEQGYQRCKDAAAREKFYYSLRDEFNHAQLFDAEYAAMLVCLNHTCYNGLYRVNASGGFNVPYGHYKNPTICDEALIAADHAVLTGRDVQIGCGDFTNVCATLGKRAFVYFDPPYQPLEGKQSFTAYAKGGFGEEEQRRLRDLCVKLTERGVRWMQSNSYTPFIVDFYKHFNVTQVRAKRAINSVAAKRGPIAEAVIRNYDDGGRHE